MVRLVWMFLIRKYTTLHKKGQVMHTKEDYKDRLDKYKTWTVEDRLEEIEYKLEYILDILNKDT